MAASSPDLNPIENVQLKLNVQLKKTHVNKIKPFDELYEKILDIWHMANKKSVCINSNKSARSSTGPRVHYKLLR